MCFLVFVFQYIIRILKFVIAEKFTFDSVFRGRLKGLLYLCGARKNMKMFVEFAVIAVSTHLCKINTTGNYHIQNKDFY